uniref:Spiggin/ChrXII n=1 Tax=Pungitius pungitius TaxID=134920 RepID=A0A0H5BJN3_9TELE|nr:Spiggin/ChrXII [Pungitius pungitius]
MTTQGWILAFCFSLASVFGTVELFETKETQTYTCRTFGSGVVQPFKGETYYVRSDCPFTLTSFTVNRGEYSVSIRRGHNGQQVQAQQSPNLKTSQWIQMILTLQTMSLICSWAFWTSLTQSCSSSPASRSAQNRRCCWSEGGTQYLPPHLRLWGPHQLSWRPLMN